MKSETDNTDKIQSQGKHWQFKQGQSGNPSGRPVGSRNKATLAVQALFDNEAEAIGRKVIELALAGDMTAIKLVLERILPPRRDVPITIEIPEINQIEDTTIAMKNITQAVASGELTPSEGEAITGLIEQQRKNMETVILKKQIKSLEAVIKARS